MKHLPEKEELLEEAVRKLLVAFEDGFAWFSPVTYSKRCLAFTWRQLHTLSFNDGSVAVAHSTEFASCVETRMLADLSEKQRHHRWSSESVSQDAKIACKLVEVQHATGVCIALAAAGEL
eukprot:5330397-Amphidinium_carterae.1